MDVFDGDLQDALQVLAVSRFVWAGVVAVGLRAIGDGFVVLVALLPVFGFGEFVIEGFGEHGAGHIQGDLHALGVHELSDADILLHVGAFEFQAETFIEEKAAVADSGGGHALHVFGAVHLFVAGGFVVEVVAAAEEEGEGFVGEGRDIAGEFAAALGSDLPPGELRGGGLGIGRKG